MKKKPKLVSAYQLFGLTEKQGDKLSLVFREIVKQSGNDTLKLAKKLSIDKGKDFGYICYCFGREIQKNDEKVIINKALMKMMYAESGMKKIPEYVG